MSQMNAKEVFHNTAYSVRLPYIAGHSLYWENKLFNVENKLFAFNIKILL